MSGSGGILEKIAEASVAHGQKIVTSAHPAASAAGIGAYARGGNAFDAALAACFMETIALPMKCGLAGDVVALFRTAWGSIQAMVSIGAGCGALAAGAKLERLGPRSVGAPGAPDGYSMLSSFATLDLAVLVEPAVRAANAGIPWTRTGLIYLREAAHLLTEHNSSTPYMPNGRIPEVGSLLVLPGLGELLSRFSRLRSNLFSGTDGERLVTAVRGRGGFLTLQDLRTPTAQLVEPEVRSIGNRRVVATPRPTFGPRLLRVIAEARNREKDLVDIVIDDRTQSKREGRGPSSDGTSVVAAADADGNAVVVVHSNSFPRFGSGVVLDDGLVLNNRPGRGFDLQAPPGADNAPAAGRVPATTLHAWAIESEKTLTMGATPGGVNQLGWNAQTIVSLLDGVSIERVIVSSRWGLDESDRFSVECEEGDTPVPAGRFKGRFAQPLPPLSLRSAQQIMVIPPKGLLSGAADPRVGARALAAY